ncbi:hypothetical protein NOF55_20785 [Rhizobiaceae bacterium BDR2-2]|uniref:Uncharacterized protein n=1 Tax=Ectorhizobium quercum TaxID=2965071 RepID=A0AAE3N3K2_9HYPH|nr:hypothetical protein [Ectorhizobium quercum]MCX8999546.1 hypothetical protein [Ectorhizobium quercum]
MQGQDGATRPGGRPARLYSLAVAFACLLIFFSAQSGHSAQRISSGLSLSPPVDDLDHAPAETASLAPECRKAQVAIKAQATRMPVAGDVLLPQEARVGAPQPRAAASWPPRPAVSAHFRFTVLAARGPPA